MPIVSRAWAGAPLAMLLASCASAGGGHVSDLAVRSALRCEIEKSPEILPTPDLLVDTAALDADLLALQAAFDTALLQDRQVTVTMGFQTDGLNMRRDILSHDTDPVVADSIQKLVFAHRRQLPPAEEEWGVRLVIGLDEEISYHVERREYCPPQPRNYEIESAMSTYLGTGLRYRGGVRFRTVVMRLVVHPVGYVAGGKIIRGGVSGSSFEQDLLNYLRQFSFVPATIDGLPTYGYIDIPVQVRG